MPGSCCSRRGSPSALKFDLKVGDFPPDLLSVDTLIAAIVGAVVLSLVSTAVRLVLPDKA